MATLDSLFTDYLKSIIPSDDAVARAIEAHNALRKDIEQDEEYGLFVANSLLSGSYGRDTAILSIKDIDIIIKTTFTFDDLQRLKAPDETEQYCLLRLTQEAIKRTGRDAKTRKARRSIHVELPDNINEIAGDDSVVTLDIVPVLIQSDKDTDPMWIADKDLDEWLNTYPNSQLSDSEQKNKNSSLIKGYRSYKSLVKMLRSWKIVHFGTSKTPKGFFLECLTAQFHNPGAGHWIEAVHDLFQNICKFWPEPNNLTAIPNVHDVSTLNPIPIPLTKTVEDAQRVLLKFHSHLSIIEQAMKEEETDLYKAAKTLQRVFGADSESIYFPLPDDRGDSHNNTLAKNGSRHDVREAKPFG